MIIELYILFQVLVLILLFLGWKDNHPMYWAMAFVFSGIQIFTSYNIEYVVMIYTNMGVLTSNIVSLYFPILSYINIFLCLLSATMFMWDIFNPKEMER